MFGICEILSEFPCVQAHRQALVGDLCVLISKKLKTTESNFLLPLSVWVAGCLLPIYFLPYCSCTGCSAPLSSRLLTSQSQILTSWEVRPKCCRASVLTSGKGGVLFYLQYWSFTLSTSYTQVYVIILSHHPRVRLGVPALGTRPIPAHCPA